MLSLNCKNVQHIKIYLPYNFEVNLSTQFGVIALFSSNFQNFNTFCPLFQKLRRFKYEKVNGRKTNAKWWQYLTRPFGPGELKNYEKRVITPRRVIRFTSKLQIYLPYNFEVNLCTQFGVIALFSSNFQNFNTFCPLFQKL
jgi:hypothetical protein